MSGRLLDLTRLGDVSLVGREVLRKAGSIMADVEGRNRALLSHPYVILGLPQVRNVPCKRCPGTVDRLFEKDMGTDAQMCLSCSNEIKASNEAKNVAGTSQAAEKFRRRLAWSGIPERVRASLGLTEENPDPKLGRSKDGRWDAAGAAVTAFLQNPTGLLVLAGSSGVGKSSCAAFASWGTWGLFLERSRWAALPVRTSEDRSDMAQALHQGGVVVLDDALHIRPNGDPGDNDHETEVLFEVAQGRHEAGRPTIITTQSDAREVITAYGTRGEALVRRARSGHDLSGAPATGGWVDCVWARRTK